MEYNNENLFWNQNIRDYRKKYKPEVVDTFTGKMPKWEYQMLLEVGAITKNGVTMDGYVVRDKNNVLLYEGRDGSLATKMKEDNPSNTMQRGSNLYSSYVEYTGRLTAAKLMEDKEAESLVDEIKIKQLNKDSNFE